MKLNQKDIKKIREFRALFPNELTVRAERSQDGGFVAEIIDFPGCFTEAENFSELIEMVNNAIKTYFDIPEKYSSFMASYVPPLKQAQRLDVFPPNLEKSSEIKLEITNREKVAS